MQETNNEQFSTKCCLLCSSNNDLCHVPTRINLKYCFSHTDCFIKLCLPETIWLNSIWPWESNEQWRYAEWLLTEIGLRWPLTISRHICILCPISNLNSLFLASWSLIYRLLEWLWRHISSTLKPIHLKCNSSDLNIQDSFKLCTTVIVPIGSGNDYCFIHELLNVG